MKTVTLMIAALAFTASAAFAYLQPGQLSQTPPQDTKAPAINHGNSPSPGHLPGHVTRNPGPGRNGPQVGDDRLGDDSPDGATNPVPEPATIMLASMGLIALGAALRRRRG